MSAGEGLQEEHDSSSPPQLQDEPIASPMTEQSIENKSNDIRGIEVHQVENTSSSNDVNHESTSLGQNDDTHNSFMSVSQRLERIITTIDDAIQTMIDSDDEKDEDKQQDSIQIVKQTILQTIQFTMRSMLRIQDFDVHNVRHTNTLFLIVSTLTVIPYTRNMLVYLFEKIVYFILTIVGTSIGIAIGLILAMNVYQTLFLNKDEQNDEDDDDDDDILQRITASGPAERERSSSSRFLPLQQEDSSSARLIRESSSSHVPAHLHSSSDPYAALMAAAGYSVTTAVSENNGKNGQMATHQRGQIVRNILPHQQDSFTFIKDPLQRNSIYETPSITNYPNYKSKGLAMFQRMWPNMPQPVAKELGELTDFIARDYVISWYHLVDDSIGYENEILKRQRLADLKSLSESIQKKASNNEETVEQLTMMILSTTPARTSPFLEILYTSLTSVLGNLAAVCEELNVPYLVLVKFMDVLKINIRTYKDVRKSVLRKRKKKKNAARRGSRRNNSGQDPEDEGSLEIAIVREYLQTGKFHQAITFGMDVPGLLFGDAGGRECPVPQTHQDDDEIRDAQSDDAILEQRLFGNNRRILHECELDYNRVLSHRLCKILFPRADFASPVLRSACVELVASMILTPIMGLFCPDYMNGWITKALVGKPAKIDVSAEGSTPSQDTTLSGNESKTSNTDPIDDSESEESDFEDEFEADTFDDHDDIATETIMKNADPSRRMDTADEILALLAMSLIELQAYLDFDDAREAKNNGEHLDIRWNDQGCIESIRNLVLIIEAMLMHGVLLKRRKKKTLNGPLSLSDTNDAFSASVDGGELSIEQASKEFSSLTVMLMELTSDIESFEADLSTFSNDRDIENLYESDDGDLRSIPTPKAGDLSTLRSLIAAWLHNGVVYKTLYVLMRAGDSVLHPFYHKDAFIRKEENIENFLRVLRSLDRVDIFVDNMTIYSQPPLDLFQMEDERSTMEVEAATKGSSPETRISDNASSGGALNGKVLKKKNIGNSIKNNFDNNRKRLGRLVKSGDPNEKKLNSPKMGTFSFSNSGSTSHLDFHRNEALASSLRTEREERMKSFSSFNMNESKSKKVFAEMICRSRITKESHFIQHKELHSLSKGFFSNTVVLNVQNKAEEIVDDSISGCNLLLMDNVTTRRRWALPDEDSSFLLRAQPVHLQVVGVHRDQRSHNLSYKKYAAYFDEPIGKRGAKLRRKCFLRFYPNDRTAAVNFIKSDRYLDSRLGRILKFESSSTSKQIKEFERYICNKSYREGSERNTGAFSNSILSSSVMDSNDFTSIPRSGKVSDFVYRLSLFEEPEVELAGRRFIVQDASTIGAHRADASSLEVSDAALSAALLLGQSYENRLNNTYHIHCDESGIPVVYFKAPTTNVDVISPLSKPVPMKNEDGLKQYKVSSVRAALLITSARREALLQSLMSDTARNLTKARADELLRPTLSLLEFATSKKREKQTALMRDLKIGVNHIDKEQLRRTGLMNPRYPYKLRALKVKIDGVIETKSNQPLDLLGGPSLVLYRLRCVAVTEYVGVDDEKDATNVDYGDLLKEEWAILRPFKDFTVLHKFLKTQVNPNECSVGTAAKLTESLTSALALGAPGAHHPLKRKPLISSLNKAVQAGTLGETKKCVEKRIEVLNEYLGHLLSERNLLYRCPELLRFVGAHDPFPTEVKIGEGMKKDFTDILGRSEIRKTILRRTNIVTQEKTPTPTFHSLKDIEVDAPTAVPPKSPQSPRRKRKLNKSKQLDPARARLLASIKARVDRVRLSKVRGSVFELIRHIFDLDGANFFRSQMVSALKTMSMAVTSGRGFRRTLMELHLKHLSSRSVATIIKFIKDVIWPDGVIFTSAIPLTKEESTALKNSTRNLLSEKFPDQLSAVLGNGITENGLDILHELINNRLVLKSMIYMMADTLLLEAFPEMADILTCTQNLQTDE